MKHIIDRRIELKRQIKKLEAELKDLDATLWEESDAGEILLGSEGYGYELTVTKRYEFKEGSLRCLALANLLERVAVVSATKLAALKETAVKEKWSEFALNEIDEAYRRADVKEIRVIREFIPQEAKVFP